MSTAKQVTDIQVGVYAYNGDYRAFEGWPKSLSAWNVMATNIPEWVEGQPITKGLSGFNRANRMSLRPRLTIDWDNTYGTTATDLRSLLNLLASRATRNFYAVTTNGTGSSSATLILSSGAPAVDDYFNGMTISGLTGGDVIVTDYVGSTRTATLAEVRTWTTALALTVKVTPNLVTTIGVSLDNDTGNIIQYNLVDGGYGIDRQLTIGRQKVRMELDGVMDDGISDSFRIA